MRVLVSLLFFAGANGFCIPTGSCAGTSGAWQPGNCNGGFCCCGDDSPQNSGSFCSQSSDCGTVPTSSPTAAPTPALGPNPGPAPAPAPGPADSVCDLINPLPPFSDGNPPLCTCAAAAGDGFVATCQQSLPFNLGSVGVRVSVLPCSSPASASISYQVLGSDYIKGESLSAGGDPILIPIPSVNYAGNGLNIAVTMTGNAKSLDIDVALSICAGGKCDGNIGILFVDTALKDAGFPLPLFKFDNLEFEQCPKPDGDGNKNKWWLYVVIGVGAIVVLCVIAGVISCCCANKGRRDPTLMQGQNLNSRVPNSGVPTEVPVVVASSVTVVPKFDQFGNPI